MPDKARKIEFDGLVVESARGDRLLAVPTAILEILRYATVIQYKKGDDVYRMRVDDTYARQQQAAQEATQAAAEQASNAAGALLANHSPAPPPAAQSTEGDALDPENVPLRVRTDGEWKTIYVTRARYEEYLSQGRIQTDEGTQT